MKAGTALLFAVVLSTTVNVRLKKKILLYYHLYMTMFRKKSDLCHPDWSQSR